MLTIATETLRLARSGSAVMRTVFIRQGYAETKALLNFWICAFQSRALTSGLAPKNLSPKIDTPGERYQCHFAATVEPPGLEKESSAEDTGASCQGRRDRCRCNESRGKPLHCRANPSHSKLNNGKEELLSSLPTLLKTFDAACDWWHLLKEKVSIP